MAGTTRQKLVALQTWLTTLSGVDEVVVGVPLSIAFVRTIFLSVLEGPLSNRTTGRISQERRFLALWVNETGGDVSAVELNLADYLDDLRTGWLLKRNSTNTADLLRGMTLDDTLANSPEYRPVAGDEARVYPVILGLPDSYTA